MIQSSIKFTVNDAWAIDSKKPPLIVRVQLWLHEVLLSCLKG